MNLTIRLPATSDFRSWYPAVFTTFIVVSLLLILLSAPLGASEIATYEYDALGRLTKVSRDDGTDVTDISYEYDDAYNRTKRSVTTVAGGGSGSGGGGNPPSNNPPVAANDFAFASQPSGTVDVTVTWNDSDPDGDALTITGVTQPSNGFVVIHSATVLRLFSSSAGTDVFTYTISDGNGGSATANVTFQVLSGGGGFP